MGAWTGRLGDSQPVSCMGPWGWCCDFTPWQTVESPDNLLKISGLSSYLSPSLVLYAQNYVSLCTRLAELLIEVPTTSRHLIPLPNHYRVPSLDWSLIGKQSRTCLMRLWRIWLRPIKIILVQCSSLVLISFLPVDIQALVSTVVL
jgi:hypothetical protein